MILDTTAVSAFSEKQAALLKLLLPERNLHLPIIVIGEYRFGLLGSRHASALEAWLNELITTIDILFVDLETARHYGLILHELKERGRMIPTNDVWIAAFALQHQLPIVSRDTHFDVVDGVRRISW